MGLFTDRISKYAFLTGVIIELIVMMTDHFPGFTLPFRGRITHVAFIIFGIALVSGFLYSFNDARNKNIKKLLTIIFFVALGILSYLTCRDEYIIRVVMMLAPGSFQEEGTIGQVVKIVIIGAAIGTAIIIALGFLGFGGLIVDIRDYGRGSIESRYPLGFNHANNVHNMLWYIIALYIIIRGRAIRITELAVIFVANIGLFFLTRSKTGFLCALMVVVGVIVLRFAGKGLQRYIEMALFVLTEAELIICTVLTVLSFFWHGTWSKHKEDLYGVIDRALTNRLSLGREFAGVETLRLLPGAREVTGPVDNGFSAFTFYYGLIMAAVLVIVLIYAAYELYRKGRHFELLIYMTGIGVFFTEATFALNTSLLCNMCFIMMLYIWTKNKQCVE